MATIKSFSDLEQSRKLAEILPLESADMYYINGDSGKIHIGKWGNNVHDEDDIPCWSLAALLDVLSEYHLSSPNPLGSMYCCRVNDIGTYASNQVDVCCEMILKLHELNLL